MAEKGFRKFLLLCEYWKKGIYPKESLCFQKNLKEKCKRGGCGLRLQRKGWRESAS
jgi:hypothetical protein